MEISSFPFLNPEEISHFYTLFQEMDNNNSFTFAGVPDSSAAYGGGGGDGSNGGGGGFNNAVDININNTTASSKKRRRKEGGGGEDESKGEGELKKKNAVKDILSSLILLDEEEKQEQNQLIVESNHDKALFDSNHDHKVRVMNHFNSDMNTHFSNLDDLDQSRTKRSRRSASAVLATASTAAAALTASGDPVQSGVGASGSTSATPPQQRRLWVKDRSKDWWDRCNHPDFPEEEFKKAFRMSKATFDMICEELDSAVMKKNTMLRDAIPVRQRVAVCIWRLATGEPLRIVSKKFGLGISTCHKLVLEVCSAIKTVLMPKFLQWPDEERMRGIKGEYESMSGIPNVGGSMYTTHIPIIAPKISVAAYFNKRHTERNQKTSYSITVQGVVDPKGVFTDVCIGWPGSMPDDQVLEKSALYQRASRDLLKDVWIVGTCGYPLMDWVLVPYTHQNLTWPQNAFNEKIGEVQGVAKDAFARLKGRWSCLQKRTEVKLQDLPVVLGACCVLHNICEMRNEVMEPELKFDLFDDEMIPENSLRSAGAVQARDHIAHNLLHHGLAGTSFL